MAKKLWDKGFDTNEFVTKFTVGKDREMDLYLAEYDVLGCMAHANMLAKVGLLSVADNTALQGELKNLYKKAQDGQFVINDDVEDVHSQIEFELTAACGDPGKKIHTARSRNDQVVTAVRLFTRAKLQAIIESVKSLFDTYIELSNKYKDVLMPGYTHLQIAMPSSFGMWFGAYAESLSDDLWALLSAWKINNRNPLGSAAGYGSSFPIDRQMTSDQLGFDSPDYNSVYCQMTRGKAETAVATALAQLSQTLAKFAADCCLFMSQNFKFISLPKEYTTGSSIMPHKANPDVFELMRGYCNKISVLPFELNRITGNLTSGYFRDLQLLKESYLPVFERMQMCLDFMEFILPKIKPADDILKNEMYQPIFTVEALNEMVVAGVPFRDCYKEVGHQVMEGKFHWDKPLNHTHIGSIGNLCNDKISAYFQSTYKLFKFEKIADAIEKLTK
ncbi:MAG: argininosuccinate lyase [Bacteroidales bacterium]|nr:argininosuccinate lyase [Bacteroidales bacterium]